MTQATSNSAALSQWLRLLWARAPALQLDAELPFIAAAVIHLPACRRWRPAVVLPRRCSNRARAADAGAVTRCRPAAGP